jgi:hypothetical protein
MTCVAFWLTKLEMSRHRLGRALCSVVESLAILCTLIMGNI